jgi:beta-phosphoglucomutase-like phosphatase (HAD superfamily)
VEDSKNGVKAAKASGAKVIVTTNGYTEKEDVEAGDVIVSCLGDPDGEKASMRKGDVKDFDGVVHVKQLMELFG